MIPILDLKVQYHAIQDEINAAIGQVLEDGQFILGPNVKALEKEVADVCGCSYGVGMASGTDALRLAMDALDIGPGDEVITTPFTFIATANTISRAGAAPIFADIDPRTFNIDPARIEPAITSRTKAIVAVHLYGQPADMGSIMDIAARHGLAVVEDSAQAIGAVYGERPVCSFGAIGCLSFFPTKNLGAYGDAGMAVTNRVDLAEGLDVLRRHGGKVKYHHERVGYNSRLDELQAAILRVKLRHLDGWAAGRQRVAACYDERLAGSGVPVTPPHVAPNVRHVYHQYTIRTPRRDELQAFLKQRGIATMIYYPVPLHRQEIYAAMGLKPGSLPEAEQAAAEVLSLPMYPELTDEQIDEVVQGIRAFYGA